MTIRQVKPKQYAHIAYVDSLDYMVFSNYIIFIMGII